MVQEGQDPVARPLSGIRIADFTRMLAGPVATMTLADLGADVVKVEEIGSGDKTRGIGVGGAMFWVANRNKRSICLDLKRPEGVEVARRLIAGADVVAESFRQGVMERLGLGFDDIREINERIIYACITGFGSTGPDRDRRGVDLVMQAESGLMSLTGETGGPPLKAGFQLVDEGGGMALAQAVLAALFQRERTGRGARIEVRLLDVALYFQSTQIAEFSLTGRQAPRLGNSVGHAAPSDMVTASDGGLMISSYFEADWQAMCRLLELDWMIEDPRFIGVQARIDHRAEMLEALNSKFALRSRDEWFKELNAIGIMVGLVNGYADVFRSPQVEANGIIFDVDAGHERPIKLTGLPYSIDGHPVPWTARVPPQLGADTLAVLAELGYSEDEASELVDRGVAQVPKDT